MSTQITTEAELDFEHVVVDSEAKVLRNVLLCGKESKNGYKFTPEAFKNSVALYSNLPVCIDHNTENPTGRKIREIAGFITNVRLENGKPYGDIEVETAIDCGVDLLALAAKKRRGIGMSHVARYKMSRDKRTVEAIEQVVTVDVVVNPATTNSFFEQTQQEIKNMDLEALKAELDQIKGQKAVLESDLEKANKLVDQYKTEATQLVSQVTTLRDEIAGIKPEFEKLKTEAKAVADRVEVEKLLTEAALDITDKVIVSESFLSILLSAAPDARMEIINDRKTAVGARAPTGGVISPERKSGTNQEQFNPASYLEANHKGVK